MEPQSEGEDGGEINQCEDMTFVKQRRSRLLSKYLPNKYIASNAQGLCGRGSHRYLHQPRDLHGTQNTQPFIMLGGLPECVMLRGARFNLQNEPLHYAQKVEDGHDAAEEDHDGQSLRKEGELVTSVPRGPSSGPRNQSPAYLKSKDVVDQIPEHERRAFFGVVQEHLLARHNEEAASFQRMTPALAGACDTTASLFLIHRLRTEAAALRRRWAELQIKSDSQATCLCRHCTKAFIAEE